MDNRQEVLQLARCEKLKEKSQLVERGYNVDEIFKDDVMGFSKLMTILEANSRKEKIKH